MPVFRAFRTLPALLLAALMLNVVPVEPSRASSANPTVLTVVGAVENTNRPPFDAFADSLFAYHDIHFEKAYAFDRTALLVFPQSSLVANATNWEHAVSASGPLLADVLEEAGVAPDATISLIALDGYAVELDAAARQSQDWVLALSADGSALGVGDRGPTWLLYDTGGSALGDDGEAKWVYSIFAIIVQ